MGGEDFRNLHQKYEQNIEVVDPQLKKNVELVEILVEFENTWTQGLTYFMDYKKCHHYEVLTRGRFGE